MIGDGNGNGNGWSSLSPSSLDGGFDGGLGLCSCWWVVVLWQWVWIVPFVVFSSDGGFDGGLSLCSCWWVVVLWQWKSGLCRLCSCCLVVVLWQWVWIVPFVVFSFYF